MKRLLLTLLFTSGLYGASIDDLTFTLNEAGTEYFLLLRYDSIRLFRYFHHFTKPNILPLPYEMNNLKTALLTSINIPDVFIGEGALSAA